MAREIKPQFRDLPCPDWCDMRSDHPWMQGRKLNASRHHMREFGPDGTQALVVQTETVDRGSRLVGPVRIYVLSALADPARGAGMEPDQAEHLASALIAAAQFLRTLPAVAV